MPLRPPRRSPCGCPGATGAGGAAGGGVGAAAPVPPSRPPRPLPTARAPSSAARPIINGLARLPPGTAEPNTLSRSPIALLLCSKSPSSTAHLMIDHQHDDRSNHSNYHAVEIETGDPARAQSAEDNTTHDCPDNAEDEVEKEAHSGLIHDLAGDEPGEEAQYNPSYDRHDAPPHLEKIPDVTGRQAGRDCTRLRS